MTRGFGIIGTGVIAAMHADAIATLPGARLVAVTDVATRGRRRVRHGPGLRGRARSRRTGSPIGKIPLDAPLGPELDRMRRIADTARELGTAIIRVFSFFVPPGEPPERHRAQVVDRMTALAEIAAGRGLVLAHENEKEIFGDAPGRCADLIASVNSPALRATFDAANFVQCGVRPFDEAYGLLRPYLVYLQVKDALAATREVVPAGQGDGQVRETLAALRDSGFDGFVSLEPHLAQAGRYGGFSGPEGFARASQSLKFILNELGISWR